MQCYYIKDDEVLTSKTFQKLDRQTDNIRFQGPRAHRGIVTHYVTIDSMNTKQCAGKL